MLLLLPLLAEPILAEDARVDLGFRLNAMTGSGEPTNDVIGYGLFGHYRWNARWSLGFAIDRSDEFDVERAAQLVGLAQDPGSPVVDNKAESTTVSAWIERSYRPDRRARWFWQAGVGVADITVDNAVGQLAGGGLFEVSIDAGSQPLIGLGVGLRFDLGGAWFGEAALRLERHFADWRLVDLESGSRSRVDDFTLTGIHVGVGHRF